MDLHLVGDFAPFRKAFVRAKERAGLGVEFRPVPAEPGCGRVLTLIPGGDSRPFRDRVPPFACEWIEVRHGCDLTLVSDGLRWYATREGSPHTVADWLGATLGGEVTEIV